jgi:hypothetical protein
MDGLDFSGRGVDRLAFEVHASLDRFSLDEAASKKTAVQV